MFAFLTLLESFAVTSLGALFYRLDCSFEVRPTVVKLSS